MGEELVIIEFVDTGFSGNKVSRISRTVFVVFLNGAPIYLFSKKSQRVRQVILEVNLFLRSNVVSISRD